MNAVALSIYPPPPFNLILLTKGCCAGTYLSVKVSRSLVSEACVVKTPIVNRAGLMGEAFYFLGGIHEKLYFAGNGA
jgi:hypothetical protein